MRRWLCVCFSKVRFLPGFVLSLVGFFCTFARATSSACAFSALCVIA